MSCYYLAKELFGETEKTVCTHGEMRVSAFRYSTGMCALRVENKRGYFIVLPFWGHQIWRAAFDGIDLVMKTAIEEPVETQDFMESYGCFMMHSGLCGVGIPGPMDTHRAHGDLPTAPFAEPRIECGEDETGKYIIAIGTYHHYVTFNVNYRFTSAFKLYENGTLIHLTSTIENLRHTPMEYSYLCHINFRPYEGAKIICTAPTDSKSIYVHKRIPASLPEEKTKALKNYMDAMQKNPEIHLTVSRDEQVYDPEIVSSIAYRGDAEGMAHTMEYRKDGYAMYVAHPIDPMNNSVRWISRTADEDAFGMVLPSTAEHLGYTNAKQKGQLRVLDGGEKKEISLRFGLLVPVEAEKMREKIEKIMR